MTRSSNSPRPPRFRSQPVGAIRREEAAIDRWRGLARNLDRLGRDLTDGVQPPVADKRKLVTGALFVQVHKSFRASLILADHGWPGDANTVLRSAAEAAIALHALEADPTFVDRLIEGHFADQAKLAWMVARNPAYRQEVGAEAGRRLDSTAQGADARRHEVEPKAKRINWEQVAAKPCRELYELVYRPLSTYATHTNVARLDAQFRTDAAGTILGLDLGPTTQGLDDTLKYACVILIGAARVFTDVLERRGFEDRLRFQRCQIDELAAEPARPVHATPG